MNIETKFNVNDLVQHKYQRPGGSKHSRESAYEVLFIKPEHCSAGTQVFYLCRPILVESVYDYETKTSPREMVHFSDMHRDGHPPYTQFREDELRPCDDDLKACILNETTTKQDA